MNGFVNSEEVSEEKRRAAYALNLCMVSVSQIIDYQDINIMEQEYEAVLNNINLENIAKDNELLDVLKQILNVITFFRIQEGDKKFIEKEYQHKMKNAIWSAIPSPSMLIVGDPISTVISLATMVGTSYMNYRRVKAELSLAYEKEMWQLQRSAIEQLNGLRREMFNASWKFAEKYQYPERYRLTERQISQYNEILMDPNPIRKYKRLEAITDKFEAYPAFWYFIGNAVNEIYMLSNPGLITARQEGKYSAIEFKSIGRVLTEEEREYYLQKARQYYEKYWEINKKPLIREDSLACACALEYADIIEDESRKEGLIDKAREYAGNALDILQLCAVGYLKIGKSEKAAEVLNILVNEEYNIDVNLQLLSSQYIKLYGESTDERKRISLHAEYELLPFRVPESAIKSIVPWPENGALDSESFIREQRDIIAQKYRILINEIEQRYVTRFYQLLPGPDSSREYDDSYFIEERKAQRESEMITVFAFEDRKQDYRGDIRYRKVAFDYIELCNEMMEAVNALNEVPNAVKREIRSAIEQKIRTNAKSIIDIQNKCVDGSFDRPDFDAFLNLVSKDSRKYVFDALNQAVEKRIDGTSRLDELSRIEGNISDYCRKYGLDEPVADKLVKYSSRNTDAACFSIALLGERAEKDAGRKDKFQRMVETFRESKNDLVNKPDSIRLWIDGEDNIGDYFKKAGIFGIGDDTTGVFAIIDGTRGGYDLIFTDTELICVYGRRAHGDILYRNAILEGDTLTFKTDGFVDTKWNRIRPYSNKSINMDVLGKLIIDLNRIILEG